MQFIRWSAALCLALLANTSMAEMPALQALSAAERPQACACEFGRERGQVLLYWPQEGERSAYIREPGGLRKLRLHGEKYLPERRDPPRVGDRQALMFSDGVWHVQAISEVIQSCRAGAPRCEGSQLRSRLIVQWQGREKQELEGLGRCGCRK